MVTVMVLILIQRSQKHHYRWDLHGVESGTAVAGARGVEARAYRSQGFRPEVSGGCSRLAAEPSAAEERP